MAPQHPEWKNHGPFKAVLANDLPALAHFSEQDWAELIFATHAGMSQAEFLEITQKWVATAKHPRFKQLFTDLTYQPMTEVLTYLRANQFETFIGRCPTAAFGNSAGDQQMPECTKSAAGTRLSIIVLHDDAAREYAYEVVAKPTCLGQQ